MEPANHFCDVLPLNDYDDFTLIFEDGSLRMAKIILLAVSGIRDALAECDQLMIESKLVVGQHLLSLLTTGQADGVSSWMRNEIQFLLEQLQIDMNFNSGQNDINQDFATQDFTILDSIAIESIENIENIETIDRVQTETIETNICDIGNFSDTELTNIIITAAFESEEKSPVNSSLSKKKPEKISYQCDVTPSCREVFEGITQFRKHTLEVHNVRPLACPERVNGCKFRADDQGKLETHTRGVHKDLYSENVTCDLCSRVFDSKSYLKSHIRRMHRQVPAQREKVCPYCGESKRQLNDHIMRAHKQKRFFCDICPKSFKTSVQRRIHRNVHTGFRPYTCQTCDLTFARLHHRKIHLEKSGHTAGPVLKPDDHVDYRTKREQTETTVISQDLLSFVDSSQEILDASEQLRKEFGVNCAEIIQNITFSDDVLDFA